MKIHITLNGKPTMIETAPSRSLLQLLREDLHLTGTKCGCDTGDCGVCSVLVDDVLVKSCHIQPADVDGHHVTTIEGICYGNGEISDLQQAFLNHGAIQCGFCIPAMLLASEALLRKYPMPNRDEIRDGIASVLCRCIGYQQIVDAVEETARLRQSRQHSLGTKRLERAQ